MSKIDFKKLFLDHHNAAVTHGDYNGGYDFYMREEYTADGYSVWIYNKPTCLVQMGEDVYYYNDSASDVLKENIERGFDIFIEEELYESAYLDEEDQWEWWCEECGLVEYDEEKDEYVIIKTEE